MIISASRRTDVPAFYAPWFFRRLKEGWVDVRNPMQKHQVSRVCLSPDVVDCIVFWTKNPKPMLDQLASLQGYGYYFQFTLTPYGADVEENLPSKGEILNTFKRLSAAVGRERVVWRYDPILLNKKYTMAHHVQVFGELAGALKDDTEQCTISFMDDYPKIRGNVAPLELQIMDAAAKRALAASIVKIAGENGLRVVTCAEDIDLDFLGIAHGKCIDDKRIERILGCPLLVQKDPNQRLACGCVASVDIGSYNTCSNGCKYCYANHSQGVVRSHVLQYDVDSPLLCSHIDAEKDRISQRLGRSLQVNQLNLF